MTLVSGLIALTLLVLFLGYYAVLIPFPPLVTIIVAILVMAISDFVVSYRKDRELGNNHPE